MGVLVAIDRLEVWAVREVGVANLAEDSPQRLKLTREVTVSTRDEHRRPRAPRAHREENLEAVRCLDVGPLRDRDVKHCVDLTRGLPVVARMLVVCEHRLSDLCQRLRRCHLVVLSCL